MGCNCGFGNGNSGGGGGGGNLSGTLTPPQFPSASAPNTLIDSLLSDHGDFILMEGNIHTQNEGNNPFSSLVAGTNGETHLFQFSRGTLLAPTDVVAGDELGRLEFQGLADAFTPSAYIAALVGDVVSAGVVPGQLDFHTADAAGVDTLAFQLKAVVSKIFSQMYFMASTRRVEIDIGIAIADFAPNKDLGDYFIVDLEANVTMLPPTGTTYGAGSFFQVRVRQQAAWTLSYNAVYRFPGGVVPVIPLTAPSYSYLAFQYNLPEDKWDCVGTSLDLS